MPTAFSKDRVERNAVRAIGVVRIGTPWSRALPQRPIRPLVVARNPATEARPRADRSKLHF